MSGVNPERQRDLRTIGQIAAYRLRDREPENSAYGVLSPGQKLIAIYGLAFFLFTAALYPAGTMIGGSLCLAAYFLMALAYRVLLMGVSAATPFQDERCSMPSSDPDLPVITILAPLYKDASSLASLIGAIRSLDYPQEKKDVKILLEEDDLETIAKAEGLGLDLVFDVVRIPPIGPRTKPKACNVGLELAQGSLVVIYDAEDRPEKDQLLKAAYAFADSDDKLACLQARLNYYNARENWLTRLFTLEYSLWFDWLLPALQKLNAPIPLGGTSNFFRKDILIEIGGWDPYNVTEDADLGLRLSKLGYRVEMLNSTTYEEANCHYGNWIRQRSRWIKGHLQTWLVHMRAPGKIIKTTGTAGLLSVQLFLAGNVFVALLNPILWAIYLFMKANQFPLLEASIPAPLAALSFFTLLFGNLCFILCAALAPLKRGWREHCLFGLTAPFYWALTSIAAYKAVWQIIFRPYYWEKTDHMISKFPPDKGNALAGQTGGKL